MSTYAATAIPLPMKAPAEIIPAHHAESTTVNSVGNARPRTVFLASRLRYTGARTDAGQLFWSAFMIAGAPLMIANRKAQMTAVQIALFTRSGLNIAPPTPTTIAKRPRGAMTKFRPYSSSDWPGYASAKAGATRANTVIAASAPTATRAIESRRRAERLTFFCMGLPPRVIDGFPAVESRWCGTREVGSRHVGLPELPIGQRGLDGALELDVNGAKAIPQLGYVRPSGHASRPLPPRQAEDDGRTTPGCRRRRRHEARRRPPRIPGTQQRRGELRGRGARGEVAGEAALS